MNNSAKPILWSFRRCPYAMRARMGLRLAAIAVEHREILLRDKPQAFLEVSPQATVPILQLDDGTVLEHSLDILVWALECHDPEDLLRAGEPGLKEQMLGLIERCESEFKPHLDRFKYHTRYDDADPQEERARAMVFVMELEGYLQSGGGLFGDRLSMADVAIFPFIRQFANTDRVWFDAQNAPHVHAWLARCIESDLFTAIMAKHTLWHEPGKDAQ